MQYGHMEVIVAMVLTMAMMLRCDNVITFTVVMRSDAMTTFDSVPLRPYGKRRCRGLISTGCLHVCDLSGSNANLLVCRGKQFHVCLSVSVRLMLRVGTISLLLVGAAAFSGYSAFLPLARHLLPPNVFR
jgi:hypothetical protein